LSSEVTPIGANFTTANSLKPDERRITSELQVLSFWRKATD
jgi:hypothetical protein